MDHEPDWCWSQTSRKMLLNLLSKQVFVYISQIVWNTQGEEGPGGFICPSVHPRHEVMWCCDAVRLIETSPGGDSAALCASYLNCNSRFIILFLFYIQFIFSDSTFNIFFLPFVLINIFVFSFPHLKWQTVIGNQIFKLSKLSWSLSARL